jgi:hypothetical protein
MVYCIEKGQAFLPSILESKVRNTGVFKERYGAFSLEIWKSSKKDMALSAIRYWSLG